jgi:DNA polymerase-3 subunit delta'
LARLSSGRIGWALQALDDEAVLGQRQEYLDQLVELLSAGRVKRLDFAWQASRDPVAAQAQIEAWIGWWRDLLLLSSQGQGHVLNLDRLDELGPLAERIPAARSWLALGALRAAAEQLQANVNPRLALESLLLKLPKVARKV